MITPVVCVAEVVKVDPRMIVHGEQETRILRHPIPVQGDFDCETKIIAIYDKGKGCVTVSVCVLISCALF